MSETDNKLWYGVYGEEYLGDEPAFFDDINFEWAGFLKANYPLIKETLTPLMHENNTDFKSYFDENIQYPPLNWKTIGFYFWGKKNHQNAKRFPEIEQVFNRIPGLISASFNLLEPHSQIKPHFGDTNAVFRVHLGIKIPAGLPDCGFTVKGETKAWEEGNLLVFLDANVHEAFNHSDERRYILLLDIIRPEFAAQKKQVCVKVLSMLSLYFILSCIPAFAVFIYRYAQKIPNWLIDFILLPVILFWHIYLPIQQRINVKKIFQLSS